ncbi:hypothetical protein HOA59_01935 [archaeon]|jgi:DNA-binding TFAR19-related protein (PDSD5 family)|nr:hypothetical protein [archaeon]MBT6824176.1 hypothetical protein [archaeon]MBT7106980.1 hypothetical protein [archaeon]MBT7297592.1 hypothetical protein [archaeon]
MQKNQNNQEELKKLQQQLDHLERLAKQHMTREAIERYGNIKIAHQELSIQLILLITQSIEKNQLREKITDEQLKTLLREIQNQKRQTKIKFK